MVLRVAVHRVVDMINRSWSGRTDQDADSLRAQLAWLQDITVALGAARTTEEVLDVVLSRVIEGIGARAGSAAMLADDGRTLEIAAAVGYEPDALERYRRFDIDAAYPTAVATRFGEPVVHAQSPPADDMAVLVLRCPDV